MLAITLGDPYSINIEMIASLLGTAPRPPGAVVVIGSYEQWRQQLRRLGRRDVTWQVVPKALELPAGAGLYFVDCPDAAAAKPTEELTAGERGRMAVSALEALQGVEPKDGLAVLTCPIEKYACRQAGFAYPGQTEYFAEIWGGEALMLLAGPKLRVGLATNHVPLAAVSAELSQAGLERKIRLMLGALRRITGDPQPRLAVCGLNPHCGEGGLCGSEERTIVEPALAAVRALMQSGEEEAGELVGPVAADSVFWQACQGRWDGVLALYHDQGLGPLKTVHFDEAVNISEGLRHFRVSPDHGPARSLFLSGKASGRSFEEAWRYAVGYLRKL